MVYFSGGHLSFAVLNRGALYTPSIIDTFALADKSEAGAHGKYANEAPPSRLRAYATVPFDCDPA